MQGVLEHAPGAVQDQQGHEHRKDRIDRGPGRVPDHHCCNDRTDGAEQITHHMQHRTLDVDMFRTEKTDGVILACRALPQTDTAVAWLGSDDDGTHRPRCVNGIVTFLDDLTHDIKLVRIAPENGTPLAFTAGQYAQVGFHIRRVPGGATSEHVHSVLKVGDKTTLKLPLGSSSLRQHHSGPILCIAGGSGMAPIKSIVDTALGNGMKQPIQVYFGVRAERDLYLAEHFQALAERHSNLIFALVLSKAASAQYRSGLVTQAVAEDLSDLDGWKAYVAGPPPMVDAAMEMAFARGLHRQDMHADVFFTPQLPALATAE